MGLIGLSLREYFITSSSASSSSSSSSSTTISFITTFLSSLTPLTPPLEPSLTSSLARSLSPRCDRFNKIYKESSYIDTCKPDIRDIMKGLVVVFLTELLSLLRDSKKLGLTRIVLNFYLTFLIVNLFIRFYITLRVITRTLS